MTRNSKNSTRRPAVVAAWIGFLILALTAGALHQLLGPMVDILWSFGEGPVDGEMIRSILPTFITFLPIALVLIPLGSLILLVSLIAITRGYAPELRGNKSQ